MGASGQPGQPPGKPAVSGGIGPRIGRRAGRRPARRSNPARGLLPLAGLLVIWQLSAADTSVALPPPSTWLAALVDLHRRGELFPAVIGTLTVYLVALVVAVVVGSSLGMAIGASRRADRTVTPLLDLIATLPGAAMVPISMLLVGINLMANAATVALAVVWPVLLNATAAMRTIPTVRLDVSRTLGLSALDRWRKIILPSVTPTILVGIRISSSLALILTLLTDVLGAGSGIGRLLDISQARFDAAAAWGLLLVVGTIGYLASWAVTSLEGALRHG